MADHASSIVYRAPHDMRGARPRFWRAIMKCDEVGSAPRFAVSSPHDDCPPYLTQDARHWAAGD